MAAVLLFQAAGCVRIAAEDLMKGVSAQTVTGKTGDGAFISSSADFAVKLFQKTVMQGKNTMISPLSVMLALAMAANGADMQTRAEMETVLGGDIPLEDLNEYLYTYLQNLPSEEKYKLNIADSVWLRDDGSLAVNPGFLQTNANYYDADVFQAPFDEQTLADINRWVSENTDGMIDKALDQLDPDLALCLINAMVFDAKWQTKYSKNDIKDGEFTAFDGTVQTVEMMCSEEDYYLDDGTATGFIKNYTDGKYSFAALLPNEGVSVGSCVASLTGAGLISTLENAEEVTVEVKMPKFTSDCTVNMNDAFKALGMTDAFDRDSADFSKLGTSTAGNLYIGEVLQKTHIEVNENGTKAAAVTFAFGMTSALPKTGPTVILDRPFVYVIVDNSTCLPIFIGVVNGI